MSAIEALLMQPAAHAIGRALLHFVWQGALIGGITALALAALRRSAADVRYVVATIGLSLMVTVPVVSAVQSWRAIGRAAEAIEAGPAFVMPAAGAEPQSFSTPMPAAEAEIAAASTEPIVAARPVEPWMRILLLTWFCGVAVLTLRLLSGWLWVQRMKSHRTSPLSVALQEMSTRLCRRLHITRGVRFFESALVDVPTVIGWLKPVVLMPAAALSALGPQQVEAIIVHELAHIRRHDYLVNLLQTLVETLLFYHPAVWWLSRRIRQERENCCDDLAVSLCGDPFTYARALADLEELRGRADLALAATGGSLLQRTRRLLGAPSHAGRGPGWLAGAAAVLLIAGIAAGAVGGDSALVHPGASAIASSTAGLRAAPVAEAGPVADAGQAGAAAQPAVAEAAREAESRAREMAGLAQAAAAIRPVVVEQARAFEERAQELAAVAESMGLSVAAAEVQGRAAELAAVGEALVREAVKVAAGGSAMATQSARQSSGNFTWSNGTDKLHVDYKGAIEFTEDDADVKSISPGGWLKIREGGIFGGRTVEFRADASAAIERRYWVGNSEKPFEPEGRQWLAQALPRFIRQTGIGAQGRVARILGATGVDGVLAEISLIEGSWARRVYYTELLKSEGLDERALQQILARVGRDLDSDFELASLLIGSADRLLVSDATRTAYFDATRTIGSDFEMRRVYAAALKKGPVSPDVLAGLLDASLAIDSDFEAASLLIQIAKLQRLDSRSQQMFVTALEGVESDFEHRRAVDALVSSGNLGAEALPAVLGAALGISSDFEQASFLLTMLKHHSIEGASRDPFFRALETVDSAFERGRVLQALARRSDVSADTLIALLRAAQTMRSGFECSQVLLAVAANHPLKGEARDLYIDTAGRLGDFEQGRVLSALVKNERADR